MKETNTPAHTTEMTRRRVLKLATAAGAAIALPSVALGNAAMTTRPIPSSGEAMPVVGLGTWQTFDIGDDKADRDQRRDVLRELFEQGGSVIDSSPMYGRSEGVVGDLLAELNLSDRAFLATKVWTQGRDKGKAQMGRSAARFRRPMIDLMQIHNLVDWPTHLETLRAWKAEGRFRYIGITHYTTGALDSLSDIIAREEVDFVQMAYSIGVRQAEERLLPLAAERGVAILVNRPYESGSLFRKVKGRDLPAWAAEFDCASWGQFFLKFILSHPAVTCVIPGTSKVKHLIDNAGAGRGLLPNQSQRERMAAYWREI